MESAVINTRTDLDALAGTAAHVQFMAMLRGTLWRLSKDDDLKTWAATQDNTTIERFGLTRADFAPVTPPVLPLYVDTTPTVAQLKAAALAQVRSLRAALFPTLAGLQSEALARGNSADATAIAAMQLGCRDITATDLTGATTRADIELRFKDAWLALLAAAPASVVLAFNGLNK